MRNQDAPISFAFICVYLLISTVKISQSNYSNPKSFVNFLLPDLIQGPGWGGVKNLRLLQGLL